MKQNAAVSASAQTLAISQGGAKNANTSAQAAATVQGLVNAENNAAAILASIPLQIVFHTIVGLTRTQCAAVAADGYEDFMEFENMQWDSIEKLISTTREINLNRGVLYVSAAKEKRIHALAF